jgi:SOS response regulatory protein OraA/RecX
MEVDTALADFGEAEQVVAATRIAERLYARKPLQSHREILDGIGTKLVRRGFSVAVARAACRTIVAGRSDPSEA